MDLMVLVSLFQFRIFYDSVILINWPTWSCTVLVFQLVLGVLPAKKKTVKPWFHHLVPHLESAELPGILWIIFKAQHFDQLSNSQQIMTTKLTQTPFKLYPLLHQKNDQPFVGASFPLSPKNERQIKKLSTNAIQRLSYLKGEAV